MHVEKRFKECRGRNVATATKDLAKSRSPGRYVRTYLCGSLQRGSHKQLLHKWGSKLQKGSQATASHSL